MTYEGPPENWPLEVYLPWLKSLTPEEHAQHAAEAQARSCANCNCHVDGFAWNYGEKFCENCGCERGAR